MDHLEAHVLAEMEKSFNQTIVYGKEINVAGIIENAKRYPMGSERQLILVKEAQSISKIEGLVEYAKNPLNTTVLAIAYKGKKIDGRTKDGKEFISTLKKSGVYFESKKFYDNQIPAWIDGIFKNKGYQSNAKSNHLIAEFLGNDLNKIANEIDKLTINIPLKSLITEELIELNVGISKDYNNFELQKAIANKNSKKSNQIIHYFCDNPKSNPIIVTISTLFSFFSKLAIYHLAVDKSKNKMASLLKVSPYFIGDYDTAASNFSTKKTIEVIELLKEYDLKSKGINNASGNNSLLLKELVFRILN